MKKLSQQCAYIMLPLLTLIWGVLLLDSNLRAFEVAAAAAILSLLPLLAITFGMPREPEGRRTPDTREFFVSVGWAAFGAVVVILVVGSYSMAQGVLWGPFVAFLAIGALTCLGRRDVPVDRALAARSLMLAIIAAGLVAGGMYLAYRGTRMEVSSARFVATILAFLPLLWLALFHGLRSKRKHQSRLSALAMIGALAVLLPGTSLHRIPYDMTIAE